MRFIVLAFVLAACQATGPSTFTHTFHDNDRDTDTHIAQVQETPTVEQTSQDNTSQSQPQEQPQEQPAPPVNEDACPSGFCM